MSAVFLPAKRTVASIPQIAAATWTANKVLNLGLGQEDIPLLLAQIAFETGLGKAMWCWNLGNAKSREGDNRNWTYFACNELFPHATADKYVAGAKPRTDGKPGMNAAITTRRNDGISIVWFYPSHPACRFRAFRSLDEGAIDHMAMLRRNFASAWPALRSGDPAAYCAALKKANYFTADLDVYTRGVSSLCSSLRSKLPSNLETVQMPWTEEDEALVAELCPGNAQQLVSIGVCLPPEDGVPTEFAGPHTPETLASLSESIQLAKDDVLVSA